MNIRERLNENPQVPTIAAGVVLVLALGLLLMRCGSGNGVTSAATEKYYYDLNTKLLVTGPLRGVTPLDLGGGTHAYEDGEAGSAVDAIVISCNACDGVEEGMSAEQLRAVDAHVGYLTRYTLKEQKVLEQIAAGETPPQETNGEYLTYFRLVSNLSGKTWIPEEAPPAMDLMATAFKCDGGAEATVCQP